uniref:RRM domain-containing protein n=1 Tax=Zooxanthella nutricula TaxID=1333877 RepID=A0A7S2VJP9_9DINO|mmetsp:Transcript_80282/g.245369  ORF Transcript_80282/g.245369 Transcript_80282/m.245369 type:complete len:185 (+) Transcript_80282:91-645(+)
MAVFVNGFDFDTSESAIEDHFSGIGEVRRVELVGRGAAVVRFDDMALARKAVDELNESVIQGNRRFVNVKIDGEKGSKGGSRGDKGYGKDSGRKGDKGGGRRFEDRTTYSGELQQGTVAKFLTDRGFGYISPDSGDGDVFVHFSAIQGNGFRELEEGQRVSFGVEPDPKGKGKGSVRAVAVSIV